MKVTQALLDALVDKAIVEQTAFPAHAADKTDCFHANDVIMLSWRVHAA